MVLITLKRSVLFCVFHLCKVPHHHGEYDNRCNHISRGLRKLKPGESPQPGEGEQQRDEYGAILSTEALFAVLIFSQVFHIDDLSEVHYEKRFRNSEYGRFAGINSVSRLFA